jgi:cell wall-associated NlpC family hydrolase
VKRALSALGALALIPVLFIAGALGVLEGGLGAGVGEAAPVERVAGIPAEYLQLFQAAGAAYGIPWEVLAGIGKVECDDGQDPDPSCTQPGAVNSAGAGGPMQFLASTWATYGLDVNHDGSASRWDPADAIYAAARYLKASGAPQEMRRAIFAYNHSAAYVETVLRLAAAYEREAQLAGPISAGGGAAGRALGFGLSQLGVPYVYGGESPAGYDCSGLVQAAYRAAGIALPRTAQEQYDAGPRLPAGVPLQPGDLVFFGQSSGDVEHVGIVVRAGEMVDAPHTGTVVRTEPFSTTIGAAFGSERYLGATRPVAGGTQ